MLDDAHKKNSVTIKDAPKSNRMIIVPVHSAKTLPYKTSIKSTS
jgi:predicted RNA binding protein YcfA (HicA-like mRNA interferase family)